ncbi:MAG: hypothetical protein JXR61_08955 [Prolixibacteraceae bacterium]|nr:hypothetical protein [Prolixibacteraceae bacterium]
MYENNFPVKRYESTLKLFEQFVDKGEPILDLGIPNPFSAILKEKGFTVYNTSGEDLDLHPNIANNFQVQVVSALEILEHLVSPFPLLRSLPGEKLIATVPLKLWFASAYRSKTDDRDRHYHEFEDWQFDWLLEKSGWKIIHREKWKSPTKDIGFRPFLRNITPRYYAIYAVKR